MRWLAAVVVCSALAAGQEDDGFGPGPLRDLHKALAGSREAQDPLQKRLRAIEETLKKIRTRGKRELEAFLLELRPEEDEASRTAYNDAVTVARAHRMKAEYRVRKVGKRLQCAVPLGRRWKVDDEGGLKVIHQLDRTGKFFRDFFFARYPRDGKCQIGGDSVDAGDLHALAKASIKETEGFLARTRVRKTNRQVRLNARFRSTPCFELGGVNKHGDARHFRCHFIKSEKAVYRLLIRTRGKYTNYDPEAAAFLESLRFAAG
ncbi:MAG: hypothetical protein ACYTGV_02005 [Planctomycetota bacterium]|jgi:hypothetical protein